ncbi:GGDEF domain-containing protein [Glaciecola sp. XM2]|jgi:diguanylate cyclase|uniref:GGDEF domain-containing protein n=1 Tax=Glaciecola sp. XM2 TaxID=1914931 RepID=UPI001BDE9EEE|nr:GGDEF domain-containing protein [Glaciecola sp. XM2]MBT1449678.1 GGDEF domain-containing protein [Glaciecola sp. XM2]
MVKHEIEKSFQILKSTVPLLLKYNISAIPTNYALWYTYVSNDSPKLNQDIDESLEKGYPLSSVKTKELYRNYLSEKEEVDAWQVRQSVEAMLLELSQSMKDTKSDTSEFKTVMDNRLDNLAKVEKEGLSVSEVMKLVRNMVNESQAIRQSTISFSGALLRAEKEIELLKTKLEESQQAALYDALTGLCNRRYFDSELESKLGIDVLSLMLIDIDHFKVINDTHGHQMGDLVLKSVAKKLQTGCRDDAQVFRYGGEEFVVLIPGANLQKARHIADVLRRSIEKISVKDRRTGKVLGDVTVSVGVAQKEKGESAGDFIERADKLLYQAKNLGRNRVMPIS